MASIQDVIQAMFTNARTVAAVIYHNIHNITFIGHILIVQPKKGILSHKITVAQTI